MYEACFFLSLCLVSLLKLLVTFEYQTTFACNLKNKCSLSNINDTLHTLHIFSSITLVLKWRTLWACFTDLKLIVSDFTGTFTLNRNDLIYFYWGKLWNNCTTKWRSTSKCSLTVPSLLISRAVQSLIHGHWVLEFYYASCEIFSLARNIQSHVQKTSFRQTPSTSLNTTQDISLVSSSHWLHNDSPEVTWHVLLLLWFLLLFVMKRSAWCSNDGVFFQFRFFFFSSNQTHIISGCTWRFLEDNGIWLN